MCATFLQRRLAMFTAPTDSGLFPERAKLMSSRGLSASNRYSAWVMRSVVGTARTFFQMPRITGSMASPMKAEVPAPVSTISVSGVRYLCMKALI